MTPLKTTIDAVLDERVVTIPPEATLRDAAELLDVEAVGALLVGSGGAVTGILSERDIITALAEGLDPDEERVIDAMTPQLATTWPSSTIEDALDKMQGHEIRHLVVEDGDGEVVGVVSMRRLLDVVHEVG